MRATAVALLPLLALWFSRGSAAAEDPYGAERRDMVEAQIRARGIRDERVLAAMGQVPRHLFVPEAVRPQAYADYPLPIGFQQTISQPYIVALMTSLLELKGDERVLEVGTGSGYQAAVLSGVAREVYTIEILEPLAQQARSTLAGLGYANVHCRTGDGYEGWPDAAPFDAILVTAAPEKIPQPLKDQLKVGGRLVIPVGSFFQDLKVLKKTETGFETKNIIPVRFVPMTGEAQKPPG
ncbi:MAG: protein-L-isoaspartate(D-aspartate) O-methyltransferase [Thermoanaerobaculia bacterium]